MPLTLLDPSPTIPHEKRRSSKKKARSGPRSLELLINNKWERSG